LYTEYGHDDISVAALYVSEEWNDLVDNDHFVQTADQSIDTLERIHARLYFITSINSLCNLIKR